MLAVGIAFAVFYAGLALILGAWEHIDVLSQLFKALTKGNAPAKKVTP